MSDGLIPAVVLGIDTQIGLAIIRDLGRHGVAVHGIARSASAMGLHSRYLQQGYVRAAGEAALIEQLVTLGEELHDACLFAISESDIALLNRHRTRLYRYRLLFADAARMQRVLNKEQTYVAAQKAGLRVPRTAVIDSWADAADVCATLKFPVVLKWSNPNDVIGLLSAAGLPFEKTHYCHDAAELLDYLQPFTTVGVYPLIQEYCPGYGLGQFILMHNGQAHYAFQHRRIHEWPPEGGVSTVCESAALEQHAELMQRSIALLRALDWEGVAMVEYRHDAATGESALMEVNGRFWGSLPLACHAGAAFPWLCYQLLGLGQAVMPPPYRTGVRCRFMVPETRRLLRLLFKPSAIPDRRLDIRPLKEVVHYLRDFVRPGTCYYVFDRTDVKPFLHDLAHGVRQVVAMPLQSCTKFFSSIFIAKSKRQNRFR